MRCPFTGGNCPQHGSLSIYRCWLCQNNLGKQAGRREVIEWAILRRQKLKEKKAQQKRDKPADTQTQIIIGSKMKSLQEIIDKWYNP